MEDPPSNIGDLVPDAPEPDFRRRAFSISLGMFSEEADNRLSGMENRFSGGKMPSSSCEEDAPPSSGAIGLMDVTLVSVVTPVMVVFLSVAIDVSVRAAALHA